MFTLYRSRTSIGFRAVSGAHHPLSASEFTREEFPDSRAAFAACKTNSERECVLMIDPDANISGHWERRDLGDGEVTNVTREDVIEALQVGIPNANVSAIRKVVIKAEASRTLLGREKHSGFAVFTFYPDARSGVRS